MTRPDRIVTVTTVAKATDEVPAFARRTIASGVDHMVVFLDGRRPGVLRALASHPQVSVVSTPQEYWSGQRPKRLDQRLQINANLANAALTRVPSVRWLVPLTTDEGVTFDRAALIGSDAAAVRLPLLEVVGTPGDGGTGSHTFKAPPTPTQLLALAAVEAIEEPTLAAYFRSEPRDGVAVRPGLRLRITGRGIADPTGAEVAGEHVAGAHLLSYESRCREEFVRRWRDVDVAAADRAGLTDRRRLLAVSVHAIENHPVLDRAAKDRYLRQIWDQRVADDVEKFGVMGLLTDPPSGAGSEPLPPEDKVMLDDLLGALGSGDKRGFAPAAPEHAPEEALRAALGALPSPGY